MTPSVHPWICGRRNTPLSPAVTETSVAISGPYFGQFGVVAVRAGAGAVGGEEGPHATGGGGRLGPVYQPLTRYLQHIPDGVAGLGVVKLM